MQLIISTGKCRCFGARIFEFNHTKWDVVFIDGDHSEDGVWSDYNAVKNRLSPQGIILFHDIWWDETPPPVDGPLKFFERENGCILNLTHMGCLCNHLPRLRGDS